MVKCAIAGTRVVGRCTVGETLALIETSKMLMQSLHIMAQCTASTRFKSALSFITQKSIVCYFFHASLCELCCRKSTRPFGAKHLHRLGVTAFAKLAS